MGTPGSTCFIQSSVEGGAALGPDRWDGDGTGSQACGLLARPDVLVKVAVLTEDGWRVDEVVAQRGKGGGDAIIQDKKMAWPKVQSYLRGRSDHIGCWGGKADKVGV